MTTLVERLRKLSAENPSPRDCIDEAADRLDYLDQYLRDVENVRDALYLEVNRQTEFAITFSEALRLKRQELEAVHYQHQSSKDMIRFMEREVESYKAEVSGYKTLVSGLEGQVKHHRNMAERYQEAIKTMQSERDANALLTDRIEELEKVCAMALDALEGMSYWSQPRKTDVPELCGFESQQGDRNFNRSAKAITELRNVLGEKA